MGMPLGEHVWKFPSGVILEVKMLGSMVYVHVHHNSSLLFLRHCQSSFHYSTPLSPLQVFVNFEVFFYHVGVKSSSFVGLICISLITEVFEHLLYIIGHISYVSPYNIRVKKGKINL